MKKIKLSNTGEKISIIGQGFWGIKSDKNQSYYEQWKILMRKGIELGITHIDTSKSFGYETIEGAISDVITDYNRDDLFLTGKLSPGHFSYNRMKNIVNKSLKRLGIKSFDLYLIPDLTKFISRRKSLRLLEDLVKEGKTRYIGVSNFTVNQFKKAQEHLRKTELVNNQLKIRNAYPHHIYDSLVYYEKKGITATVYSTLRDFSKTGMNWYYPKNTKQSARAQNITVQQISIAWLIDQMNVVTLLNPLHIKYLEEISETIDLEIDQNELVALNNFKEQKYIFNKIENEIEINNSKIV